MAPRAEVTALVTIFFISLGSVHAEYTSQGLSTHVDTLLAEYDREVPPQWHTVVAVTLDARHVSVSDGGATMRMLADLKMSWQDLRITWNTSEWEGDSALVPAERLWTPDVTLLNAGGGGGAGAARLHARVSADGAVSAVQRLDVSVPVALQLGAWPRDEQQAEFLFASRTHGEDEIELLISNDKNKVIVENGAWELVSGRGRKLSWNRTDDTSVSAAAWTVRVRRRSAAQAAATTAVFVAAALLLVAAAVQPYAQRPPLAACAAFVAALWLTSAMFHVPAAASCPRALSVMCGVCVAAAACGAGAAAAARVARRRAAPSAFLRALLSRVSAIYTLAPDPESPGGCASGAWAAAARLLDAALLSALLVTLVVLAGVYFLS